MYRSTVWNEALLQFSVARLAAVNRSSTVTCGSAPDAWLLTATGTVATSFESLLNTYLVGAGYTVTVTNDLLLPADGNET